MALDCRSKCGASEYAEDVANPNWLQIEARLVALEASAGLPAVYNNTTRPNPASVPLGRMIFNTDDNAPNWRGDADGVPVWVDASGNITSD